MADDTQGFADRLAQGVKSGYVDFTVAKQVTFVDALAELGLLAGLRRDGDELKGICPLHGGEKESFGVNVVKGYFNCFGCKKKGNVLDFVREFKKCGLKDAAQWLVDLLERLREQVRTPAGESSGAVAVREQVMCRAIARYLSAVFPILGDAGKIEGELSRLVIEEAGKLGSH